MASGVYLCQASEILGGVWDNAAMLLDEGRPDEMVVLYFARYMLQTSDKAARMVAHLRHPIWGRNELSYASGQKLIQPWLQGLDKLAVYRRFLMEQFTPSQLAEGMGGEK